MACCPFHDDKHPSMKVDRRFHRFGCQADGDVIDFTARLFGLNKKEAALKLAEDFSVRYDAKGHDPPRRRPVSRKISEELLEVLGIGEREQAGIPLLLALLLLQYLQIIIAAGACCTEQQKQENDARDAPSMAFLLGLRAIGLCAWSVWGNGRRSIGHGFLHGLQWGGAVGANRSRFHHIFVAVGTLPDISAYRYTAMWACSSQ